MRAFHDDPDLKESLRGRLEIDLARHAIGDGATAWHNNRGSLAGSLLRTAALTDGPARIGIPETVLALLDLFGSPSYAGIVPIGDIARRFMDAVRPGADLRTVPAALIDRIAGTFERDMPGKADANDPVHDLAVLIETQDGSAGHVTAILDQWLHARSRYAMQADGWSDEQENRAQEILNRLWDETESQRRAGHHPSYPDLFAQTDPELAAGYVRGLEALNRSYQNDVALLADWFIDLVRAA